MGLSLGCDVDADEREDCGFGGITDQACEDLGCCFDDSQSDTLWCFYKRPHEDDSKDITYIDT